MGKYGKTKEQKIEPPKNMEELKKDIEKQEKNSERMNKINKFCSTVKTKYLEYYMEELRNSDDGPDRRRRWCIWRWTCSCPACLRRKIRGRSS